MLWQSTQQANSTELVICSAANYGLYKQLSSRGIPSRVAPGNLRYKPPSATQYVSSFHGRINDGRHHWMNWNTVTGLPRDDTSTSDEHVRTRPNSNDTVNHLSMTSVEHNFSGALATWRVSSDEHCYRRFALRRYAQASTLGAAEDTGFAGRRARG